MKAQAYFNNIHDVIVSELAKAKNSIYLAVSWFTNEELFEMLCSKAKDGLNVSVMILDDEINNNCSIDFDSLLKSDGQFYKISGDRNIMHNKFCVIDGRVVISGSYNWTNKAYYNDENIIVVKDSPKLINKFMLEYFILFNKYFSDDSSISESIWAIETSHNKAKGRLSPIEIKAAKSVEFTQDELQQMLDEMNR